VRAPTAAIGRDEPQVRSGAEPSSRRVHVFVFLGMLRPLGRSHLYAVLVRASKALRQAVRALARSGRRAGDRVDEVMAAHLQEAAIVEPVLADQDRLLPTAIRSNAMSLMGQELIAASSISPKSLRRFFRMIAQRSISQPC
jgi:hypothetical protein